jgi:hypothetical protein
MYGRSSTIALPPAREAIPRSAHQQKYITSSRLKGASTRNSSVHPIALRGHAMTGDSDPNTPFLIPRDTRSEFLRALADSSVNAILIEVYLHPHADQSTRYGLKLRNPWLAEFDPRFTDEGDPINPRASTSKQQKPPPVPASTSSTPSVTPVTPKVPAKTGGTAPAPRTSFGWGSDYFAMLERKLDDPNITGEERAEIFAEYLERIR